jgi:methylenetetrahydrofolate reductase (NADPH)
MTALPITHPVASAPVSRIVAVMNGYSIEATRPSDDDFAAFAVLPHGTRVYLSALPNRPPDDALGAAMRVRAAGHVPVPHIAVRNFASAAALDDYLARLNGEAAVDTVLVIAGDRSDCGPYRRALDAIDSGVLRRRGITTIGISGYPEGHPRIGDDELARALADKSAAAQATGLAVEIVTQFCFDPKSMLDFVARLRGRGIDHPVRMGLAGPTSLTSLMRYAARCGVRTSAQMMARRAGLVRQMFAMATPDDLVRSLADAGTEGLRLHFFSFGGVPATARWTRSVADGAVALENGSGFRVEPPKPV